MSHCVPRCSRWWYVSDTADGDSDDDDTDVVTRCQHLLLYITLSHWVIYATVTCLIHHNLWQPDHVTKELCCNVICRRLINLSKSSSDTATRAMTVSVGSALFYAVTTYVSQETKFYPPTRQFFSFCIEMLGQVWLSSSHLWVRRILYFHLKTKFLVLVTFT